jgi:plastin-1
MSDNFTPEEQAALEKIFKQYDTDNDGYLDKRDIVGLIQTLGVTELTEEYFDDFLSSLYILGYSSIKVEDLDENRKISLKQYFEIMKNIKLKENSLQISSFIKDMEKVNIQKENESISENPEKDVYIKIINDLLFNEKFEQKYLPIDPTTNEIFDKIKDGILLCKLINKAKNGSIDERTINKGSNMTEYQQRQNLNLAISEVKSLGLKCGEISSEIIIEKSNLALILNFIGEICKFLIFYNINLKEHPELINILDKNEKISDLVKLSTEQILLKWFNYHIKNAGNTKPIQNFTEDIKDSEKYIILLNQLDKDNCDKEALNESDVKKRAEIVLSNAEKLKIKSYISSNDIISGNGKLNYLFVGQIFNSITGLKPPNDKQKKEINDILSDDDKEERIYRIWINSLDLKDEKGEEIIVNNLIEQSKDGVLLLRVIDKIKSGVVSWKKVDKKPKNVFKQNANCGEVINCCKKLKFNLFGASGEDIREGRKKYVLSLVWQMMKMHSLQIIGDKTENDLVKWGNEKVNDNLRIKNLRDKKLSNSLFFIEILKSIEPNVVNLDDIIQDKNDEESKENNAKQCISAAKKLGVIVFLEWKDIVKIKSDFLLTFLASLYNIAQNYQKKE